MQNVYIVMLHTKLMIRINYKFHFVEESLKSNFILLIALYDQLVIDLVIPFFLILKEISSSNSLTFHH